MQSLGATIVLRNNFVAFSLRSLLFSDRIRRLTYYRDWVKVSFLWSVWLVLAFASAGMIPLFNAVGCHSGANLGHEFRVGLNDHWLSKCGSRAIALSSVGHVFYFYFIFLSAVQYGEVVLEAVIGIRAINLLWSEMERRGLKRLRSFFDLSSLGICHRGLFSVLGMVRWPPWFSPVRRWRSITLTACILGYCGFARRCRVGRFQCGYCTTRTTI